MNPEVQVSEKCEIIIDNLNSFFTKVEQELKTAVKRAQTAEDMVTKIKDTLSDEIKKAYKLGIQQGSNLRNTESDSSGGTEKQNEDVAKLVLEN